MRLYGMSIEAFHAMRGFAPVLDAIERAARWLDPEQHLGGVIVEQYARAALELLEGVDEMCRLPGPRGEGARFARASVGPAKLEEMRAHAREIVARREWERAEACAITGGHAGVEAG